MTSGWKKHFRKYNDTSIVNGVEDEEEMDCDSIEYDRMFHVFIERMQD